MKSNRHLPLHGNNIQYNIHNENERLFITEVRVLPFGQMS